MRITPDEILQGIIKQMKEKDKILYIGYSDFNLKKSTFIYINGEIDLNDLAEYLSENITCR